MFIVYSPEGRNRIGQPDPARQPLKVDPAQPTETSVDAEPSMETVAAHSERGHPHATPQTDAYESVQEGEHARRRVVKVGTIMSSPVAHVWQTTPLLEAWQTMQSKRLHHLPVLHDQTQALVGLLSSHGLLMHAMLNENNEWTTSESVSTVADVMSPEVLTTHMDTDIRRAAQAMGSYHIGCLPIMDAHEQLVGIITLSDIVKRLGEEPPLEIYV